MSRKTIAEHMRDILIERYEEYCNDRSNPDNHDGHWTMWYGSLDEIHACAKRAGVTGHLLEINRKILAGVDRSKMYEKYYIKHIGRPARAFMLKEEYRPEEYR